MSEVIVPCLADGVVISVLHIWSNCVAEEIVRLSVDAVIRGYIWLVGEGA